MRGRSIVEALGVMCAGVMLGWIACQTSPAGPPNCPDAGMVVGQSKISELAGGFTGNLSPGDQFGRSVALLGDLDGDGVTDLAVGAENDDDGGPERGAVYILFMNANGTVRDQQKISSISGGFVGPLAK